MTDVTSSCWACGAATGPDGRFPDRELESCAGCGLLYEPRVSVAEAREGYEEAYFEQYAGGAYDSDPAQRRHEARVRARWVARRARERGRLLEVGAAAGWFLDAARDQRFEVRGIEPAETMAALARERFGVDVEAAFVEDADLPESSLDVICAWHVLEHIREPLATLERLRAALRTGGGLLMLEVPNVESVQAQRLGADWPHLDLDHHVAHFAPRSLTALLERAGFTAVHTETIAGADYHRPGVALRPGMVAGSVRWALGGGGIPHRPHPSRGELLRATARA